MSFSLFQFPLEQRLLQVKLLTGRRDIQLLCKGIPSEQYEMELSPFFRANQDFHCKGTNLCVAAPLLLA